MADVTPKHIIEVEIPLRLGARPELRLAMNAVVVFDITGPAGGQWTLDTTRSADWVKPGADGVTPRTTLTCSDRDFVAVCTQKLNAPMAVAMGKLKFKPMDTNLALKLAKLIG